MVVLYEDNHIIVVSKAAGEIVQGDKTGDTPLSETVKQYIKERYHKPGNVFLGVVHRLDRPVSGLVLFARTSKALPRLNEMFAHHADHSLPAPDDAPDGAPVPPYEQGSPRIGGLESSYGRTGVLLKEYWAIVTKEPPAEKGTLTHWLTRNERTNTARAYDREVPQSKKAVLDYRLIARSDRYWLLAVRLHTGRHHQIRCQLAKIGCPIKGDLKYGAPRSNPDGSISLHARRLRLEHPVSHQLIDLTAPVPQDTLWQAMEQQVEG